MKISKSSAAQTWGKRSGQESERERERIEESHLFEETVLERPFRSLPTGVFKLFRAYSDVIHVTSEHKVHLNNRATNGKGSLCVKTVKMNLQKKYEGQSRRKLVHQL